MALIIVSNQEAASNTDILQGTRLQTIGPGVVTVELQSSDNDATNNYTASMELANGKTPMNATRVPSGNSTGLAGVIDDRTALKVTAGISIQDGPGHLVLSCIESGSAELTWRVSHQSLAR